MIKEIKYNGVTTTPDDYLSEDGDLAYAKDLIHKDDSLRNAPSPSIYPNDLYHLPEGFKLIYIHKQPTYTNFIVLGNMVVDGVSKPCIGYINKLFRPQSSEINNPTHLLTLSNMGDFIQATHIGNALCLVCKDGNHMAVWREDKYELMPTSFPVPKFNVNLIGKYEHVLYKNPVTFTKRVRDYDYDDFLQQETFQKLSATDKNLDIIDIKPINGGKFPAGNYCVRFNFSRSPVGSNAFYPTIAVEDSKGNFVQVTSNTRNWSDRIFYTNHETSIIRISFHNSDGRTCAGTAQLFTTSDVGFVIKDDDTVNQYERITAAAKQFINDYGTKRNRFIYPFFLKVAYRTVDNSYICPSAPILLTPNSGANIPLITCGTLSGEGDQSTQLDVSAVCSKIQFQMKSDPELAKWKDYITDVVIAVTPQIYSWDQSVIEKDELKETIRIKQYFATNKDNYTIGAITYADADSTGAAGDLICGKYTLPYLWSKMITGHTDKNSFPANYITLPEFADYEEQVNKADNFYIIKEIPVKDIIDGNYEDLETLDISKSTINNLVVKKSIPDDASSLNQYFPNRVYAFNNRLHIADYRQKLFNGYDVLQFVQPYRFIGQMKADFDSTGTLTGYSVDNHEVSGPTTYKSYVSVKDNNSNYTVETRFDNKNSTTQLIEGGKHGRLTYFYYPNINAYEAVVYMVDADAPRIGDGANVDIYEARLTLQRHPTLNGAYWYDNGNEPNWTPVPQTIGNPPVPNELYIQLFREFNNASYKPADVFVSRANYMKLSELNQPMVFSDAGTYQFDSRVLAMQAITTALSTGQKGQFDLYVFTEQDGIWSPIINNEGKYSKQIPVNRDTLTNVNSLISIDDSLIYATKRGLMLLTGSQSKCISTELDNPVEVNGVNIDFRTYVQKAYSVLDYINHRIIIFQSGKDAFSLDTETNRWTVLSGNYDYPVNSYPDQLVVNGSGQLLNLSGEGILSTTQQEGSLLTRPFDLDAPNDYKIIDRIRQNGYFKADHLSQKVFGSNDLINWVLIAAVKNDRIETFNKTTQQAYRFFKLSVDTNLADNETLDSFTCSYRIKNINEKVL